MDIRGINMRIWACPRWTLVLLGAVAFFTLVTSFTEPALANVIYPSDSITYGYAPYMNPSGSRKYPEWREFSWLGINGNSYVNQADYVVGVQRQLRKMGYDPGTYNDGIFGSQTESAVETFQDIHDLAVDGIVGTNSWDELAWYLEYGYTSFANDYHHVYTVPGDYWRMDYSLYKWSIRNSDNSAWVAFTTNGPS
jgi:hypothetical protein